MTAAVEHPRGSRAVAAVLGALLAVEMIFGIYVMLVIWPDVAAIPNVAIVTSSKVITSTTTTAPAEGASTSITTTPSTSSTTVPPSSASSSTTSTSMPRSTPSNPPGVKLAPIDILGITWTNPSPDSLYLVTVIALAAIGALVHALSSLAKWTGKRQFQSQWVWWYLVRVPVGVGLGLVFYAVIRGGLLSVSTDTTSLSPYGIGGIAALTGMFAKQVSEKLHDVFVALFGNSDNGDKHGATS